MNNTLAIGASLDGQTVNQVFQNQAAFIQNLITLNPGLTPDTILHTGDTLVMQSPGQTPEAAVGISNSLVVGILLFLAAATYFLFLKKD